MGATIATLHQGIPGVVNGSLVNPYMCAGAGAYGARRAVCDMGAYKGRLARSVRHAARDAGRMSHG